jgi:SAM-dependent methyltransferase
MSDDSERVTFDGEALRRHLGYVSGWATAELLRGLLDHHPAFEALMQGATEEEMTQVTGLAAAQVHSLLEALRVEDVVALEAGTYRLTSFGRALEDVRGWGDLVMQGYAGFFRSSELLWRGEPDPGWRVMPAVGEASARIASHDVIPLVTDLIPRLAGPRATLLDVGCGTGRTLVELCRLLPEAMGVGVEQDADLAEAAAQGVLRAGLDHRVRIVQARVEEPLDGVQPDVVLFGFVLHELIEQLGRERLVALLASWRKRHPAAWFIALEIDDSSRQDLALMRSDPLLRGFYNYYFLLQDLTDQRLLSFSAWTELLTEAGLVVHGVEGVSPDVDPTGAVGAITARAQGA